MSRKLLSNVFEKELQSLTWIKVLPYRAYEPQYYLESIVN